MSETWVGPFKSHPLFWVGPYKIRDLLETRNGDAILIRFGSTVVRFPLPPDGMPPDLEPCISLPLRLHIAVPLMNLEVPHA